MLEHIFGFSYEERIRSIEERFKLPEGHISDIYKLNDSQSFKKGIVNFDKFIDDVSKLKINSKVSSTDSNKKLSLIQLPGRDKLYIKVEYNDKLQSFYSIKNMEIWEICLRKLIMLEDMLITVDVLKYNIPDQYEGLFHCYVHEFDRIVFGNFSPLGISTNFYFLHMGYKKNIKLILSFEDCSSNIIVLKDEAKDCIITNLYSYAVQIIGTFIGYEQENDEKIAKILVNNFVFKISCSRNEDKNNLIQGQKIYFRSLIRLEAVKEFNELIDRLYKNVRLSIEELENWPKDKSLWPDPELKVGKGDSPLEQLIINNPEYVKKKLGREHCNNYPIDLEPFGFTKNIEIRQDDLKAIEHLIQK